MKENYPIYVKWAETLDWIMDRTETFPKTVRFTLSTRIVNLSMDILELIVETIYSKQKIPILNRLNLQLEKLRVLIRICQKRKYLSIKQYEYIASEINETGRMLGGWKKVETGQSSL